jgi:cell division septal protein FtsQ
MANRNEPLSRADQVRARRKLEPAHRKPIPRPAQRAQREAESSARVIARRTTAGMAQPAGSKTRPQRRIYLPTSTPGSEIRLPAVPEVKIGWRLLSIFLVVLMGLGIYLLNFSNRFEISTLNLSGAQRIPAEEILDKLELTGKPVISIIPAEIEAQILAAFPDIKSAIVTIDLPAQLNINVQERIPAITWYIDDTPSFWVDEEGFAFPIRGEATIPRKVMATSDPPRPLGYLDPNVQPAADEAVNDAETSPAQALPSLDPQFVASMLKLRNYIPAGTALLYDPENGLGWTDEHGWKVFLGTDISQIDVKLAEYQQIVATLLERNLQPIFINIEYIHAPYYRLE